MNKQLKNIIIGTGFGVTLFVVLSHFVELFFFFRYALSIIRPFLIGVAMAFVINVPMKYVEGFFLRAAKKRNKNVKPAKYRLISLLITLTFIIGIVIVAMVVVIPQIIESVGSIIVMVRDEYPKWLKSIEEMGFDTRILDTAYDDVMSRLASFANTSEVEKILSSVTGTISTLFGMLYTIVLAFIFMLYILLDKERVVGQFRRVCKAYLPSKYNGRLQKALDMLCVTYSNFLGGQCVDAAVLASLIWLAYTIFGLPYSGLVAVLTMILCFVPYVGCFMSCMIGALVIFMVSPVKALISIAVYLTVQFTENQLIYPRLIGGAVGLPPVWTLFAVFIGGELFGIVGMIFFIPLMATVYALIREHSNSRIARKEAIVKEEVIEEQA